MAKLILNLGLRHEHIKGHRDDYGKSDAERKGTDLSSRENIINSLIPGFGLLYKINSSSNAILYSSSISFAILKKLQSSLWIKYKI